MPEKNEAVSVLEMARGAILERANYEVTKIIENISDPNTKPTEKRKLTLTLEFLPDDSRQNIGLRVVAKSALAPTSPIVTSLFMCDDNEGGKMAYELTPNIPGQTNMFGGEQEPPKILKLYKNNNEEKEIRHA